MLVSLIERGGWVSRELQQHVMSPFGDIKEFSYLQSITENRFTKMPPTFNHETEPKFSICC